MTNTTASKPIRRIVALAAAGVMAATGAAAVAITLRTAPASDAPATVELARKSGEQQKDWGRVQPRKSGEGQKEL